MRSSLELAVDAAAGCDALAVLLVDTPGIGADAVRDGRSTAGDPAGSRSAATRSRRGHPTVMAPALWREALELGRRRTRVRGRCSRARPELVDEIVVAGDAADLDTPDDLARWGAP